MTGIGSLTTATAAASTSATANASAAAANSASTPKSSGSSAPKTIASQLATPNLFLKLLMAELQHENPTNPTTPTSILQQTAMLSQVESITTMTTTLNQQRHDTQASEATSLIGRRVSAVVTGAPLTGTVTQVALTTTGTPLLSVNGTYVPLASIVEVDAPATTGGTVPSTTAGGTGGTGGTGGANPATTTTGKSAPATGAVS